MINNKEKLCKKKKYVPRRWMKYLEDMMNAKVSTNRK